MEQIKTIVLSVCDVVHLRNKIDEFKCKQNSTDIFREVIVSIKRMENNYKILGCEILI